MNTTPLSQNERLDLIKAFAKKGLRLKKKRVYDKENYVPKQQFSEDYLEIYSRQFTPSVDVIEYHVNLLCVNKLDNRLNLSEN